MSTANYFKRLSQNLITLPARKESDEDEFNRINNLVYVEQTRFDDVKNKIKQLRYKENICKTIKMSNMNFGSNKVGPKYDESEIFDVDQRMMYGQNVCRKDLNKLNLYKYNDAYDVDNPYYLSTKTIKNGIRFVNKMCEIDPLNLKIKFNNLRNNIRSNRNSVGPSILNINIILGDKRINVEYYPDTTVEELRKDIAQLYNYFDNKLNFGYHYYLKFENYILEDERYLSDYMIQNGSDVLVLFRILGGVIEPPVKYADLFDCQYIIHENERLLDLEYGFKLQSVAIPEYVYDIVKAKFNDKTDFIIKLIEDIGILSYYIVRSKSKLDYIMAITQFIKLRIDKPILATTFIANLLKFFESVFHTELQSIEETFLTIRDILDKYEMVKELPIFQKLYKFLMYALSMSLFDKVGVNLDTLRFSKISQEAIKKKYHMGPDFIHTLLDTILFLCERGYQCMKTGSMDAIFHSGSTYEEWISKATDLKNQSHFLTNPEPHGIDRFKFLSDLNDIIEKGEAIKKYAIKLGNFERKIVLSLLSDLCMIKSNELTKRSAQQDRKAPFSILLYGGSSIAKSTLTKILYYQYGKIFDLCTDPEYKYTRNPVDQYWVNFNSTQWCVQLDDIAFLHPNSQTPDPSLMEMLQVVNNVPFVPVQADLSDKGRTPLKSRFVIATTNTDTLNADSFFSCPLAVQRRLPFVVDARPKDEYLRDQCMLDGHKVPVLEDGEYPDYWYFDVKRVVPTFENASDPRKHQRAKLEIVESFDNIYVFLQWFSKEAIKYEGLQDKTLDCDNKMSKIQLCKNCYLPLKKCVCLQSRELTLCDTQYVQDTIQQRIKMRAMLELDDFTEFLKEETTLFDKFFIFFYMFVIYLYFTSSIFNTIIKWFYGDYFIFKFLIKYNYDHEIWKYSFRYMGRRIQKDIGYSKFLIAISTTIVASYSTFKLFSYLFKSNINDNEIQGSNQSKLSVNIGKAPIEKDEERVNVWYKNDVAVTSFDISPVTSSYKSFNNDYVDNLILNNCVFMKAHYKRDGENKFKIMRSICVSGHIYLINNHCLPDSDEIFLTIIVSEAKDCVNGNIKIKLSKCMIRRFPEKDLCLLNIRNIPPKKNLMQLFCKDTLRGNFKGKYLMRNPDGDCSKFDIHNINYHANFDFSMINTHFDIWSGYSNVVTENGHCGSILVSYTENGPIIMGIHVMLANNKLVGATKVSCEFLNKAILSFDDIIVQSGTPLLSSETAIRELGDLHKKSPIRFTPEGTGLVYGSFVGFRPKMKSMVGPTFIRDVVSDYGYKPKHDAPVMNTWEPWYLALKDMTRPVTLLDMDILNDCVNNFTNDILKSLSKNDLKQVYVYDDITSLNGAAGVTYVDKINRNTSAGNPWKKSKKYFLRSIPAIGELMDPVEANEEIMSRVNICIETYLKGERYMPNFCAHLKDEPTSFKKIETSKTRVFTGAPFDWTIVVRKYLLSIIRLIQNNRFIFESGPGTIAQSLEWQEIYEHITAFGKDRMIAGDYGKFDKRMPSTVILAAFDIIINICKAAGYTEEELLVVKGIAEDTAFPVIDFNGDLIQTFGSNPSGHPLTVIINGLANSLYMRYCYAILSPNKCCRDFKDNVHLMTYGDDNCMGVNRKITFFDHTSIQKVLADIDIEYTMAEKEAKSVPFIHIDEVSFLKRTWKWDDDVGAFLCPLDHGSIEKMLTTCVRSKTITPEAQSIAVISTALREYFYYGKDIFNDKRKMFIEIIDKTDLHLYVNEFTLPTWDELYKLFWDCSKHVKLEKQSQDSMESNPVPWFYKMGFFN